MKKRLRYKMFNSCIILKGFDAKETEKNKAKICKDVKALRYFYKMYLHFRKKNIKAEFTFTKKGFIDEDDL